MRVLFLTAVLRQEIGWFDLDSNTSGALTARLSSDAPAVRGAVADVLGLVIQNVSTLVFGYTVAFINGWKMTLVVTAALPLLGFSSYMQMKFFTGMAPKSGLLPVGNSAISKCRKTFAWVCGMFRSQGKPD